MPEVNDMRHGARTKYDGVAYADPRVLESEVGNERDE